MVAVSVLLPVYNSEQYLKESIDSVLNQSFKDFELIILNDGSNDHSLQVIESYKDSRIKLLHSERNKGLIYQLNRGLQEASGKYIARMDADDISHADRFRIQYDFLEKNPDYILCGTNIKIFYNDQEKIRHWKNFVKVADDPALRIELMYYNAICHPTVMYRRDLVVQNGLYYDEEYHTVEDYRFWCLLSGYGKIFNLEEVLLYYRLQPDQVSQRYADKQLKQIEKIRSGYRADFITNLQGQDLNLKALNYLLEQYDYERNNKIYKNSLSFFVISILRKVKRRLFFLKK